MASDNAAATLTAADPPPSPDRCADVVAVIVTYQVQPPSLQRLLGVVLPQVAQAVVVDNASPGWTALQADLPLQVIRLEHNQGLAQAQNLGLQAAVAAGARFVLLLDQDSLPEPGMVRTLRDAHDAAIAAGYRVAAVGPVVLDELLHSDGFVRFDQGRYRALAPDPAQRWMTCDLLIASGTLMPVPVVQQVGLMAETLFIDKVDIEWCLRARAAGFDLLGVPQARLHHHQGERQVRLWFGRWRHLQLHRPFRYYYMVRNSLLLRRLPHAQAAWRRADRLQLLSLLLHFGVLAPGRWQALRMMARGLIDGLRGRGGPLP
jgi:rhamnosyltransferase